MTFSNCAAIYRKIHVYQHTRFEHYQSVKRLTTILFVNSYPSLTITFILFKRVTVTEFTILWRGWVGRVDMCLLTGLTSIIALVYVKRWMFLTSKWILWKKYTGSNCQSKMPFLKYKSQFSTVSLLQKFDILRYLGQWKLGTTEKVSKGRTEHHRWGPSSVNKQVQ